MSKKAIWLLYAIIPILTILVSCSKTYYSSEVEIPIGNWKSDQAAVFSPEFNDTVNTYNLFLSISNSDNYRYSNIWFFIKTVSPEGFVIKDTIEVFLAEENGKWFGEKSGDEWTYQFLYKKHIRFPSQGKYQFELFQGMRDIELKGIRKLGFDITESKSD